MAPFPETEIMTIQRLEVALRKMDLKLLKDGAYKLHEKFHGGFHFEYIDNLKNILYTVKNDDSIPEDIKSVLIPTIEDILEQDDNYNTTTNSIEQNENHVSSLTSLSYSTPERPKEEHLEENNNSTFKFENKINAFDAFGSKNPNQVHIQEHVEARKTYTQSPFSAQPFQEFNSVNQSPYQTQNQAQNEAVVEQTAPVQQVEAQPSQAPAQAETKAETETKTIAIFYYEDSSAEKNKNIIKYRDLLTRHNSVDIWEILNLIKEINTQSNTNVTELKSILEQLNSKNHTVNLLTNSSSANLTELLQESNIAYTLNEPTEGINLNILPLLGLTNLFKCSECKEEFLNTTKTSPMVLTCPNCKSPMFPNLYSINENTAEMDISYYNSSLITLANSKVWLIIHPSVSEKISLNMLRSALKVSKEVEEIFIIDKDINVRETYKNLFYLINENVKINTQISVIEDFFKLVG